VPSSGTLTFATGETRKSIPVLVKGDHHAEPNEMFSVSLSSPTNATIAEDRGLGTILDDEPRICIDDEIKCQDKQSLTTLFTFGVARIHPRSLDKPSRHTRPLRSPK
jgi:hypothetical protein